MADTNQPKLYEVPVWAWTHLRNKAGDGGVIVPPDFAEELLATGDLFPMDARRGWACTCGEYNGDATFCCGKCRRSR